MKTKLIIPIIVAVAVAVLIIGTSTEIQLGQKNQYKFWVQEIKLEGDNLVTRVFFSHSNDYGQTFSEPRDMSMTEDYAHEPKMITMYDDVILVWRDEVEDDTIPNLSFAKSIDFGETFEKKRLDYGARPDIVHYDEILYLTWVDLENRRVLYSTSDDRGETFVEPTVIFAPQGEFSPYADKPTPKLAIDDGTVKISWSMLGEDYEHVIGPSP